MVDLLAEALTMVAGKREEIILLLEWLGGTLYPSEMAKRASKQRNKNEAKSPTSPLSLHGESEKVKCCTLWERSVSLILFLRG